MLDLWILIIVPMKFLGITYLNCGYLTSFEHFPKLWGKRILLLPTFVNN